MSIPDTIKLHISEDELIDKLKKSKAWLFDWDGVFNNGHKGPEGTNTFSERDSMGTNMMRYAHYLRNGEQPYCAIITGASNSMPRQFGEREHFHAIVPGALYKRDVVEILLKNWGIKPEETAFFFDDILDLNVSEFVGLRVQIRYESSASVNRYIDKHQLADVVTTTSGQNQAVRQIMDYFISLLGQDDDVIHGRMNVSRAYQQYFNSRQEISTKVFSRKELLNQQ